MGNTISAILLKKELKSLILNQTLVLNVVDSGNKSMTCGIRDCPGPGSIIARPDNEQVDILRISIELYFYIIFF